MNDNIREKLVELINEGIDMRVSGLTLGERLADHMIASGVTVQEWIPVKDRLPEDGVQVLACTKHGKAFSAHCEKGRFRVSGSVTVTHWMPLPHAAERRVSDDAFIERKALLLR